MFTLLIGGLLAVLINMLFVTPRGNSAPIHPKRSDKHLSLHITFRRQYMDNFPSSVQEFDGAMSLLCHGDPYSGLVVAICKSDCRRAIGADT